MSSPTVFAINTDLFFFKELQRRLNQHSISIEPSTLTEVNYLLKPSFQRDCVLINVDLSNIQQLLKYKILENFQQYKNPVIVALVPDDSLYRLVKNHSNDNVLIFNANLLLDKLVSVILNNLPGSYTRDGDYEYFNGINGYLDEVALPKLISFFKQNAFTGRVFVETSEEREGLLQFSKGEIQYISYNNLSDSDALKQMIIKGQQFRVEQHLLSSDYIVRELNKKTSGELSLNDLLIDLFYFMHEEFERVVDLEIIQQTVENALKRFGNWEKDGIYFIYNPQWQEKLQIVGEVNPYQVSNILEMYETIFADLSGKTHLNNFCDFVNSLDEIKPYMSTIQPLQPIMNDDPVFML